MKWTGWQVRLGIILVLCSAVIYMTKFIILGDPENTYYYIFNALGFLPINVLLVTLVLNELLSIRSKKERLEKINMVIGTFFSEAGTHLLTLVSDCDPDLKQVKSFFLVSNNWDDEEFSRVGRNLKDYDYTVDIGMVDLVQLRTYLMSRRDFLVRLLENPVILEHQSFTGLLQAVFHLTEELERRKDLDSLPAADLEHLSGDIDRVYRLISGEWLSYMKYLKNYYPYLFSLAIRTNPFDENASAVIIS
jgi:hypothetical protein